MRKKMLLIPLALLLALSLAATACAPTAEEAPEVVAPEKITLRGQAGWPEGFPIITEGAVYFAKRVGEISGGRLEIEMTGSGSIVPGMDVFEAVHLGTLDVGCTWASFNRRIFPAAPLFGAIVGGPGMGEYGSWVVEGGGLELWQEMYDRKDWNVKVLPPFCTHSAEIIAWSNVPIRTLEDFEGLKYRSGGYYWGQVLEKLGASVVTLPGGEIIPSLERGVIDCAEFSVPCIDVAMGFHEIAKYLTFPGVHQPASVHEALVNKDVWEPLPDDLKEIMKAATSDSSLWAIYANIKRNSEAYEFFSDYGIEIIEMSPEVQKEAVRLANEIYDEIAAGDAFFAEVLASQREFHNRYRAYLKVSTLHYDD